MKVVSNNLESEWSMETACHNCKSTLLINRNDLFKTFCEIRNVLYSRASFECNVCKTVNVIPDSSIPWSPGILPKRTSSGFLKKFFNSFFG